MVKNRLNTKGYIKQKEGFQILFSAQKYTLKMRNGNPFLCVIDKKIKNKISRIHKVMI